MGWRKLRRRMRRGGRVGMMMKIVMVNDYERDQIGKL